MLILPAAGSRIRDKNSAGPSIRSICTGRCFTMTDMIQVCSKPKSSSSVLFRMISCPDLLGDAHLAGGCIAPVPPVPKSMCPG